MDGKNSISSAPARPQKQGSVQNIVRNDDIFKTSHNGPFEEITLSDDDEPPVKKMKCPTCSRDMTLWTDARRKTHTICCKTQKEDKAREKAKLTKTIEKDDKIIEKPEVKVPKEPSWELSKNNVRFARIAEDDEANRRRKRPRSFAVVQLAPKNCQCEVLTTLHSKFMEEFHFKSLKNHEEKKEGVSEHAFQMKRIIEKLARYEQLSADMQKTLDDNSTTTLNPNVLLKCQNGEISVPRMIIKHRTTMLKMNPKIEIIQIEKETEVVKVWLTFVFTANIEWNEEHLEDMKELASKYGPVGLDSLLRKQEKKEVNIEEEVPQIQETVQEVEKEEKQPEEVVEPEEVDVFTSDDPLIGFGKVPDKEEEDLIMLDEDVPSTSSHNTFSCEGDSFDNWSNQSPLPRSKSSPVIKNTPTRCGSKPVFGSNVKIIKTTGITPMPEFDAMDEAELKERMKAIGMRPKGKKVMIKILKDAYNTLHPEVCIGTPTIRPLIKTDVRESATTKPHPLRKTLSERMKTPTKLAKVTEEVEVEDEHDRSADKTLNLSNDEREVGKICGDDVIGEDEDEEKDEGPSTTGNKDMKTAFLQWLRSEENEVLYDHILSLQPVSLDEVLVRLEKAEGPIGRMGKGKLVKVLDSLRITYQLPQKGGTRKFGGGGFKKRFHK